MSPFTKLNSGKNNAPKDQRAQIKTPRAPLANIRTRGGSGAARSVGDTIRRYSDRQRSPAGRRGMTGASRSRRLPRPLTMPGNNGGIISTSQSDTDLKIIPLGGLGEVGRNMTVMEYKDDIIIIDVGFGFPEEDMPGIDYVIPNIKYLEERKQHIRGIIFTHGHYDHIGAVPYVLDRLGNPPMYATALTYGIIVKRQEEFPHLPKPKITTVKPGDRLKLGDYFDVEFVHINHNIPDSVALAIRTAVGLVFHTGDFKFDDNPVNDKPADIKRIQEIGDEGVLLLMSDSTGAEQEGHTLSESKIFEELGKIFQEAGGMIISGTFSSLINRIQQLVTHSEAYNRRVIFDGYSLKTNVVIAKELGYIKIQKGTEIDIHNVDDYKRDQVTLIGTGAQGEGSAVLMRIANEEHRFVKLLKGDSIVFSSSIIPGNERSVQYLKDQLYRAGAKVYHYKTMDIHASGHAQQEDLKRMIELVRPGFLMPIHGHMSMLVNHGWLGERQGIPPERIIIAENGSIIRIAREKWFFDERYAPSHHVYVDGLGIGDIGAVVLRDRQMLAQDGMFVIVVLLDRKTGKVRTSPDIISRGFVYLRENVELLNEVRKRVRMIAERKGRHNPDASREYIRTEVREHIGQFLFQKTQRRPMVLPVVIEV